MQLGSKNLASLFPKKVIIMVLVYNLLVLISALLFALAATPAVRAGLLYAHIMDNPNERSNHKKPVPRGGGIAMIGVLISFVIITKASGSLVWSMIGLMLLCFADDVRGIPARYRFLAQILAILWVLPSLEIQNIFGGILPAWAEAGIIAVCWLWFINLFNFMDGADGLAGSEAICISLGVVILALSAGLHAHIAVYSMITIGAVAGFLVWNWYPAKIFMGDSGSVPLGFFIGFVLILIAGKGYGAAALILPAYFITDATITLLWRALRGERIWQAHSKHAYQRAIRKGMKHDQLAGTVIALNILLIALAVISTMGQHYMLISLGAAYGLSLLLIIYFRSYSSARQSVRGTF